MSTQKKPIAAIATNLALIILMAFEGGCGGSDEGPPTAGSNPPVTSSNPPPTSSSNPPPTSSSDPLPTASSNPIELTPGIGPVTIGPDGGSFELVPGKLTVVADPGTLTDAATIAANEVAVPAGLAAGLKPAASAFEIAISDRDVLDRPLQFAMPYDSQAPGAALVLHYDALNGYQPATVVRRDAEHNLIYFEARSFSPYVGAQGESVPDVATVTLGNRAFNPRFNGFSIPNVTYPSLLSKCGSCLGMVAVSRWQFFRTKNLSDYTPQAQTVLAILAHAGANYEHIPDANRSQADVVKEVKANVALLEAPVALVLYKPNLKDSHAVLVYGYDRTRFFAYDPNYPGQVSLLPYSNAGILPYDEYSIFEPLAVESFAPQLDIDKLLDQAEQGFDQSNDFRIDSPTEGQLMDSRHGRLTGTVTNTAIEQLNLITSGGLQIIEAGSRTIAADFPVFGGENSLILLGGPRSRSRMSYARNGGLVRTVNSQLKKAELFTMITWKQAVDVDLYVHAPGAANDVAWYDGKLSASGMSLDFDSTKFGPEAITLSTLEALRPNSRVVTGSYRVRAHYYEGQGAASGEVLIAVNENKGPGAAACRLDFVIPTSNKNNDQPGSNGPDWIDLASVDVASGQVTPAPGLGQKCKAGNTDIVPMGTTATR